MRHELGQIDQRLDEGLEFAKLLLGEVRAHARQQRAGVRRRDVNPLDWRAANRHR